MILNRCFRNLFYILIVQASVFSSHCAQHILFSFFKERNEQASFPEIGFNALSLGSHFSILLVFPFLFIESRYKGELKLSFFPSNFLVISCQLLISKLLIFYIYSTIIAGRSAKLVQYGLHTIIFYLKCFQISVTFDVRHFGGHQY